MEVWEQFTLFMRTRKSRGEIIEFFVENYKVHKSIMVAVFSFAVKVKILCKQDLVFYVINI